MTYSFEDQGIQLQGKHRIMRKKLKLFPDIEISDITGK